VGVSLSPASGEESEESGGEVDDGLKINPEDWNRVLHSCEVIEGVEKKIDALTSELKPFIDSFKGSSHSVRHTEASPFSPSASSGIPMSAQSSASAGLRSGNPGGFGAPGVDLSWVPDESWWAMDKARRFATVPDPSEVASSASSISSSSRRSDTAVQVPRCRKHNVPKLPDGLGGWYSACCHHQDPTAVEQSFLKARGKMGGQR